VNAHDYVDWCQFAGLYLANISCADRYRTFQRKLSQAGVVTYIVHDFLRQNDGGIDVTRWRSQDVYEMGSDAAFRVEQTALALEAVGAPRAAAKVRTARNTSPSALFEQHANDPQALMDAMRQLDPAQMMAQFRESLARAVPELSAELGVPAPGTRPVPPDAEIESWEHIEHLLAQYARTHERQLRSDLEKHGDVRTRPGFDPAKRMEELDQLRQLDWDRERQKDDAATLTELMEQLEAKLARRPPPKPGKIASERRKFLGCYRRYADRPTDQLIPSLRTCLPKAARFQDRYPDVFRPRPVEDEALLKRLAETGPYDVDIDSHGVRVSWDSPEGFACDWTTFSLSVEFPPQDEDTLRRLLDVCARLRLRFPQLQEELRDQVLESFENYRDWVGRIGFDGYELDETGNPTEASILKQAGDGGIHLDASDADYVRIAAFFSVDWDDEHGLEIDIEDDASESIPE